MKELNDSLGRRRGMIIVLLLIVIVALVAVFFVYKSVQDKKVTEQIANAYGVGYNKSLMDVAIGQTQTGEMVLWIDNGVQITPISSVCQGMGF